MRGSKPRSELEELLAEFTVEIVYSRRTPDPQAGGEGFVGSGIGTHFSSDTDCLTSICWFIPLGRFRVC